MLTAAAGGDVNSDPYDGHAIAADDIVEEGTWKSYDTLLDDPALWSDGKPDGLDVMNCAFIVVETGMEDTTERYRNGYLFTFDEMISDHGYNVTLKRLIDYDCTETKPFICERPKTALTTASLGIRQTIDDFL